MHLRGLPLSVVTLACLALTSAGCIVSTPQDVGPGTGLLSVAWTIEGSTSPAGCADAGADALAIDIYDFDGRRITTLNAPCEDFLADIDIDPGSYSLDLTLVDTHDHAMTTTLTLDADVREGGETDLDIDFPYSSFL